MQQGGKTGYPDGLRPEWDYPALLVGHLEPPVSLLAF